MEAESVTRAVLQSQAITRQLQTVLASFSLSGRDPEFRIVRPGSLFNSSGPIKKKDFDVGLNNNRVPGETFHNSGAFLFFNKGELDPGGFRITGSGRV